jgi:hypothetical protein
MGKSTFGTLNWADFGKGLVMAVLAAVFATALSLLQAGTLFDKASLTLIGGAALTAFLGYITKNLFTNSQGELLKTEKSPKVLAMKYSGNMAKVLLFGIILSGIGLTAGAQLNTKHLFGNITQNDVVSVSSLKSVSAPNYTLSYFLRITAAESAYEIPLFKGGGGQFFSATGLGLSVAAYDLSAVEKFSANFILFVPNTDSQINGVSTALTIGVPIPKLNLPNINVGIREDWKAKVTYLQTSITLEF